MGGKIAQIRKFAEDSFVVRAIISGDQLCYHRPVGTMFGRALDLAESPNGFGFRRQARNHLLYSLNISLHIRSDNTAGTSMTCIQHSYDLLFLAGEGRRLRRRRHG